MDYDSYDVYERNSPVDCGGEAEMARERSRRIDRARREREDELQWEQDRTRDRNYGSKSFEDEYFAGARGYREPSGGKYEDTGFGGEVDYWEPSAAGKTFDYNHGMSGTSQAASKQKAEFARRETGRRLEDNLNLGINRDPRPSIARDIKDEPSTSIFLGGIPRNLDENDLENELIRCGLRARDIRIIRSKETGANRGFAFVDFHSVPDAQRWMELNQGRLFLRNRFTISMDYSKTGSIGGSNGARGGKAEVLFKDDWRCSKCGCDNFQRRVQCFKCGLSKAESEKVRAKEPAESRSRSGNSSSSSCTLVIRGLDGLTEESGVEQALGNVCGDCRMRNIFIVRNEMTGIGEGYGYLEFYSRQEAEDVVDTIRSMDCPLEIDGKEVLIDYSRESFVSVVTSINQSLTNSNVSQGYDYSRTQGHQYSSYYSETDVHNTPHVQQSNMSSESIPKSAQYAKQYLAETTSAADMPPPIDAVRQGTSFPSDTAVTLSDNEFANYASPDLNRYVFDDLTGYYIDPVTGLYYDAGTQYFYQMETSRFLYWDPDKNCYIPASEQGQETINKEITTLEKSSEEIALSKQEEERQEKANAAKKIAKDMDKWVKAQNSQKESGFKKPLAPISMPPKGKPPGAADAGFNVIAKSKFTIELPKPKEEKKVLAAPALPGLVAYSGDSDSDTEADEDDVEKAAARDAERAVEEKLIDWGKLTCLLCRRAFSSADILTKHRQLSDLHKSNLEDYKKKLTGTVTRATTVVAKALGVTKSNIAKR